MGFSSSPNLPHFVSKTPVLTYGDPEKKREEIRRYFHDTFTLYESLFDCLASDKGFYHRANSLRHPLIFYYGHTSVFFINKLNVAGLITRRVDPHLESLLAVGVDEMSWDDLDDTHYDWPTPAEVQRYRKQTRVIIDDFISNCHCSLPITWDHPLWIVVMGIEHERIHLETTSVLIRELPLHLVRNHSVWGRVCNFDTLVQKNELLPVEGGQVQLGKSMENPLYGWDNEYGSQTNTVLPFQASKFLVSNAEFKHFVDDGGYTTREYWTDEGWEWLSFRKPKFPVNWIKEGDEFLLRNMLSTVPMRWSWPVEVNYLESKAFCNWKKKATGLNFRLPSEAEWAKLRELEPSDQPYWSKPPGNINLEGFMSPCPVSKHKFDGGFFDIIGNVWQWTETPVDGFEDFQVHPAYDDFSTPTFDGRHNLIKGGCWISTGNYSIKDSRYSFRRHFFQHSGFRYVVGEPLPEITPNIYEQDSMVAMYLEFHYGPEYLNVPNFPVRCIAETAKHLHDGYTTKALDIGCASGRSSFELAKLFDQVDAVDLSARLLEAPSRLQSVGTQRYTVCDEGELLSYKQIQLCDYDGYEAVKDRIQFSQGDACNLIAKYTDYDLVFAGNLLDRLYDPAKFLRMIKERINVGGMLVITSPYTWLEEHTPRSAWLGGFKDGGGERFTTLHGLQNALTSEFELITDPVDIPFVIRETSRKFQHTFSQFSAWRKVS